MSVLQRGSLPPVGSDSRWPLDVCVTPRCLFFSVDLSLLSGQTVDDLCMCVWPLDVCSSAWICLLSGQTVDDLWRVCDPSMSVLQRESLPPAGSDSRWPLDVCVTPRCLFFSVDLSLLSGQTVDDLWTCVWPLDVCSSAWIYPSCGSDSRSSRLAVNRGSRLDFTPRPTLFFLPAGFCCLVSSIEETPSARLSKLENYGFDQLVSQRDWHHLLNEKSGFWGTCLSWRDVRGGYTRDAWGEVANRMSGGSFRGGRWGYLPFRHHDNRYSADWIRLYPGLSKNSEDGNSCSKSHKAARFDWSCGKSGSAMRLRL